jgi:hypothetical protein
MGRLAALIASAAALLLFASTTAMRAETSPMLTYECGIISSTSPPDSDPIYKVEITFRDGKLAGVTHVSVAGVRWERFRQYGKIKQGALPPNYYLVPDAVYWEGVYLADTRVTMRGTLKIPHIGETMTYIEKHYRDGWYKGETTMICHEASVSKAPEVHPEDEKKSPELHPENEKKAPEVHPENEKKAPELHPENEKKAPEPTAEYKSGELYLVPRHTDICDVSNSYEVPSENCMKDDWKTYVVRLWSKSETGWCFVVRWDKTPHRPDRERFTNGKVWKKFVECKNLIHLPQEEVPAEKRRPLRLEKRI